jgi:hypothetical protein
MRVFYGFGIEETQVLRFRYISDNVAGEHSCVTGVMTFGNGTLGWCVNRHWFVVASPSRKVWL